MPNIQIEHPDRIIQLISVLYYHEIHSLAMDFGPNVYIFDPTVVCSV